MGLLSRTNDVMSSANVTSYSSFCRSENHKMQAVFFFFVFSRQRVGWRLWSQAFLAETVEPGHENLVDVIDNGARYSTFSKTKNMSNVLANGVIFSTLKRTDHTEREFGRQKELMVPGVPSVKGSARVKALTASCFISIPSTLIPFIRTSLRIKIDNNLRTVIKRRIRCC